MFFNDGDLLHRRIFENADRTRTHPANPLERRIERKRIKKTHASRITDVQKLLENGIPIRFFTRHFKRLERNLVRGAVTHQHIPVPIVNVASVSNQLNSTQAVIFGALEILFVMQVLQRKKLEQNHRKDKNRPRQKNQDVPIPTNSRLVLRSIVIHPTSSPK